MKITQMKEIRDTTHAQVDEDDLGLMKVLQTL